MFSGATDRVETSEGFGRQTNTLLVFGLFVGFVDNKKN